MILDSLRRYEPTDARERDYVAQIIALIETQPDCFYRHCFNPGHVTGSALLLNHDHTLVLLNHHKVHGIWLGFGGHADGEDDTLNVARREIIEESGIVDIVAVSGHIFDVDMHRIVASQEKSEPAHIHYDISYLFKTQIRDFVISDESIAIEWCSYDDAMRRCRNNPHMARMLHKWQALL
jgi:8-oxo-dGTP pyrophosphatase MutT (NUDIX family)